MQNFIYVLFLVFPLLLTGQELTPAQKAKAKDIIRDNPNVLTQDLPADQKAKREQILQDNPDLLSKEQKEGAKPDKQPDENFYEMQEEPEERETDADQEDEETAEKEETDSTASPGRQVKKKIYGRSLFSKDYTSLTSSDVPEDYMLVPGDQILLRLWGRYNLEKIYTVGDDGYVFIDPLNKQTYLKGMTHKRVKQMIRQIVSDMAGVEGEAKVIAAHPLKINVSGHASRPGTILVPPYFTFWQALMASKGPSAFGSVRDIRLSRQGKIVHKLDIYDYLKTGKIPNLGIKENDLIFFGEVQNVVEIRGIVRRQGLYEIKTTETLEDLITIAGNFSSREFSPYIQVERIIPVSQRTSQGPTRKVLDLALTGASWMSYRLQDGDIIYEKEKFSQIENYVYITGAGITVPSRYSISGTDNTLWRVIQKAGGLLEGYSANMEIVRITPEGSKSILLKIDDLEKAKSFTLEAGDSILTYHASHFQDPTTVKVMGFVRGNTIEVPYSDSLTLLNVLQRAGGTRDGAIPYVYVKKTDDRKSVRYEQVPMAEASGYTLERRDEVYAFSYVDFNKKFPVVALMEGKEPLILDYADDLNLEIIIHRLGGLPPDIDSSKIEVNTPDFSHVEVFVSQKVVAIAENSLKSPELISPGALVIFRNDSKKEPPEFVHFIGEFVNPGDYALRSRKETLKSLIKAVGGITTRANPHSIYIKRRGVEGRIPIPVRDDKPLTFDGTWLLTAGDRIYVSRDNNTVEITGAVFNPGMVSYKKGYSWKDYVNSGAGGPLDTADYKKTFIIYPSSTTVKAKKGWFRSSQVLPGSRIIVPFKPYKPPTEPDKFDSKEFFTGVSATLGAVTSLITVFILVGRL